MDNTFYKRHMITSSAFMPATKGVSKITKLDATMFCYLSLLSCLPKEVETRSIPQSQNEKKGQSQANGLAQAKLSDFIR